MSGLALQLKYIKFDFGHEYIHTQWTSGLQTYTGITRFYVANEGWKSTPLKFLATEVYGNNLVGRHCYQEPFIVSGLILKECSSTPLQHVRIGHFEFRFGLPRSDIEELSEVDIMMHGLDGRMDAPNIPQLAEAFGFRPSGKDSMRWAGEKTLLETYEIM